MRNRDFMAVVFMWLMSTVLFGDVVGWTVGIVFGLIGIVNFWMSLQPKDK